MRTRIPLEVELPSIKKNELLKATVEGVVSWLNDNNGYSDKFYKAIRLGVRDAILIVHSIREKNNDGS